MVSQPTINKNQKLKSPKHQSHPPTQGYLIFGGAPKVTALDVSAKLAVGYPYEPNTQGQLTS